jgi:cbb3-type cytochrome oxidase subunit 1
MDLYTQILKKHFFISLTFLLLGLIFGFIYSINLLGYSVDGEMLQPGAIRSVHISLMLYGFIPLMLSYLPFMLIYKDLGYDAKAFKYLEIYAQLWYFFLFVMVISILMGVRRHLAFYDFHYSLNFILAFSGIFYILALYRYINLYEKKPLWIRVSFALVLIAPVMLLFLMNPVVGQVEATISGPHGDNTLGMSLAIIPIYYLIFKYLAKNDFKARWNIFWIVPLVFYMLSIAHRSFIGPLSYAQEWFFQWLSLLYIPLLIRWYKDAKIESTAKKFLFISIFAYLFVDIQGNILFIESIRWQFHRNDLIVAHAHIALGIGLMFMALALYTDIIKKLNNLKLIYTYISGIFFIFLFLSIAGFTEAGYADIPVDTMWLFRTLGATFSIIAVGLFFVDLKKYTSLELYNIFGVLSDGLGGILLILTAGFIYPLVGFSFSGVYEYVVFGFVSTTGLIHFFALIYKNASNEITYLTVVIRFWIASIFLSLFLASKLSYEALFIATYDFSFALFYLLVFYKKDAKNR